MQTPTILTCLIWALIYRYTSASISFTNKNYSGIQAGVPFTLTWEDAEGSVMLGLLFKNTNSSPQNATLIASGITESQFIWTPPDWTSEAFEHWIEAEDQETQTLTANFTVAAPNAQSVNTAPPDILSVVAVPTKDAHSTSSSSFPTPTSSKEPVTAQAAPQSDLTIAGKARIGFSICFVIILVTVGIALIFFEHGKRVASRADQPKTAFERAEQGSAGLQLAATTQEEVENAAKQAQCLPLLCKMPPEGAVELDVNPVSNVDTRAGDELETRRKHVLSVRSIYELG